MQNLSLRLRTIASLVPHGARVCDIGTDHGYLSIYLRLSGIANSIIATDINKAPLESARKNIEKFGAENIELRLCNGLEGIEENEADTFIIAGMGGEVISGIIERGKKVINNNNLTLILQPTTSPEYLRRFLYSKGFEITDEIPLEENSKLYSVMRVRYIGESHDISEAFCFIGKIKPSCDAGKKYIAKQQRRCLKCAEQLQNVPYKQEEYLYYKTLTQDIKKLAGE